MQVKSLADISNFANHFTNEMVSNLRPAAEAETCDVFSDFRYKGKRACAFDPPRWPRDCRLESCGMSVAARILVVVVGWW